MGRLCHVAEDGAMVELRFVFGVLQVGSPRSMYWEGLHLVDLGNCAELPLRFSLVWSIVKRKRGGGKKSHLSKLKWAGMVVFPQLCLGSNCFCQVLMEGFKIWLFQKR